MVWGEVYGLVAGLAAGFLVGMRNGIALCKRNRPKVEPGDRAEEAGAASSHSLNAVCTNCMQPGLLYKVVRTRINHKD